MKSSKERLRRQSTNSNRRLEEDEGTASNSSTFAPIRIEYDTRWIDRRRGENAHFDTEIDVILNEIIPQMSNVLADLLYIEHPYNKTSEITVNYADCGVPEDDGNTTENWTIANVDLVVLIGGDAEQNCAPRQLAYARPCTLDRFTDRPILGKMEFCLNQTATLRPPSIHGIPLTPYYESFTGVSFQTDHLQISLLDIALHEMMHVLAFSSQLFPYFRDETGAPRMPRDDNGEPIPITRVCGDGSTVTLDFVPSEDIVQVIPVENGHFHQYLVTPMVRAIARQQFRCDSVLGGRLADGSECIASHWHERLAYGDLMGPRASRSSENTLSLLTLALLADSGWYQVNFRKARHYAFGLNAGCDFVSLPCIDNTTDRVPEWIVNEFCDIPYLRLDTTTNSTPDLLNRNIFCDPGYRSWTLCDLVLFDDGSIPSKSYFSSPLAPLNVTEADFCPIPDIGLGLDCSRLTNGTSYSAFYPGERVGEGSRCINGYYNSEDTGINTTNRPACMFVTCDTDEGMVRIGQGPDLYNCTVDGEAIPIPSRPGSFLVCPRLAAVCPELYTCPSGCFGRGTCVAGNNGSRPECRCFDETNTDSACAPSLFAEPPSNAPTKAPTLEDSVPSLPNSNEPSFIPIKTVSSSAFSMHCYCYQWIVLLLLLMLYAKRY